VLSLTGDILPAAHLRLLSGRLNLNQTFSLLRLTLGVEALIPPSPTVPQRPVPLLLSTIRRAIPLVALLLSTVGCGVPLAELVVAPAIQRVVLSVDLLGEPVVPRTELLTGSGELFISVFRREPVRHVVPNSLDLRRHLNVRRIHPDARPITRAETVRARSLLRPRPHT